MTGIVEQRGVRTRRGLRELPELRFERVLVKIKAFDHREAQRPETPCNAVGVVPRIAKRCRVLIRRIADHKRHAPGAK